MGLFQRVYRWAKAADTTLSLFDMVLRAIGASTVLSGLAAAIAWLAANPYAALVVGLASWIAIAILLLLIMAKQAGTSSSAESEPEGATPSSESASSGNGPWAAAGTIVAEGPEAFAGRLKAENEELKAEIDDLKLRGIPEHMIAERHIRYHPDPIRLLDLLELAGEDGVIRDFSFDHCILEGPGIINLEGPFPKPETTGSGLRASASVGPTHCRVEGSPDTTLYQTTRSGNVPMGLIHLAGYRLEAVTFRDLGFAGTPDHLKWLRDHLLFSEGNNVSELEPVNNERTSDQENHRRKRIEGWRSVIRNFNFDTGKFASTDTYSQMKPHLKSETIEMFEAPRTVHIGNEARGETTYKYTLLDEVARIEREWGLV